MLCRMTISPVGDVISRVQLREDTSHSVPSLDCVNESQRTNSKTKRLSLRDLVQFLTSTNRAELSQSQVTQQLSEEQPHKDDDDISTIELVSADSNGSSLQGQPRSCGSATLGSDESRTSVGRSKHSTSQDSLGDYKQNFPYEPPRQTEPTFRDRHDMEMTTLPVYAKNNM